MGCDGGRILWVVQDHSTVTTAPTRQPSFDDRSSLCIGSTIDHLYVRTQKQIDAIISVK